MALLAQTICQVALYLARLRMVEAAQQRGCVLETMAKFILAILVQLQRLVTSIKQQAVVMSWILLQAGPRVQTEIFDFSQDRIQSRCALQVTEICISAQQLDSMILNLEDRWRYCTYRFNKRPRCASCIRWR